MLFKAILLKKWLFGYTRSLLIFVDELLELSWVGAMHAWRKLHFRLRGFMHGFVFHAFMLLGRLD